MALKKPEKPLRVHQINLTTFLPSHDPLDPNLDALPPATPFPPARPLCVASDLLPAVQATMCRLPRARMPCAAACMPPFAAHAPRQDFPSSPTGEQVTTSLHSS
jgi:hypothetical protein